MFGLNFNEFFEQKLLHKNHIKKIKHAKPTIDTSSPKSKLKCTKQPLSQFHRVYQMQSENKHLYHKISKPSSSIENKVENYTIIKNNRKQYYEQYERNLENFGLMRRIKSAKTNYSVKRLMEERKQNQQYLKLKSKFGYKDQVNLNFRYNLNMLNRHEEKLFSCRQQNSNKVKTKKQQNKIISYSSRKTTKQTTLEQVKTRNNKYESLQVLN